MENQLFKIVRGGWMLLRFIAVLSSSIVIIISSLLPLYLYTNVSETHLIYIFFLVTVAAVLFHGVLTHIFNDYADFYTGTDAKSPAVLSGGSRVIQNGMIAPENMFRIGKWLAFTAAAVAVAMAVVGRYDLALFIFIGIWVAASYSLPPFRFSYRPFLGEWLSLFPAMFVLGIAGPWLVLHSIQLWAAQNALINSLICMGWVMVHHIPDIEADLQANPKKRTTVAWLVEKFGLRFVRLPAFVYFSLAGLGAIWVSLDRFFAAVSVFALITIALYLIGKIQPKDVQ